MYVAAVCTTCIYVVLQRINPYIKANLIQLGAFNTTHGIFVDMPCCFGAVVGEEHPDSTLTK